MGLYRKKPVVIAAEQYFSRSVYPKSSFLGIVQYGETGAYVETLEGPLHVSDHDWIIRGVKGEFYPCKPDIFAATYEAVRE